MNISTAIVNYLFAWYKKYVNVSYVLTDHAGVCVDVGRAVHELEGVGAELCPVDVRLVMTRQKLGEPQPDYLPRKRLEHREYK